MRQREEDIEHLEVALNDLKDSMMKELEYKNKEFDTLRRVYDETCSGNESLKGVINSMNAELDNSHGLINEL